MKRTRVDCSGELFASSPVTTEPHLRAAREAAQRMVAARHGAQKAALRRDVVAHLKALTSRWRGYGLQ